MQSKEEIFQYLQKLMVELFEVENDSVKPESLLYDDLDIDSIDAVDMIVKLKEITGKKLQPSDFKEVRSVQDVIDAVYNLLQETA